MYLNLLLLFFEIRNNFSVIYENKNVKDTKLRRSERKIKIKEVNGAMQTDLKVKDQYEPIITIEEDEQQQR